MQIMVARLLGAADGARRRRGRRARRRDLSRARRAASRAAGRRGATGAAAALRRGRARRAGGDDRAARRPPGAEVAGGADRRRARRRLPACWCRSTPSTALPEPGRRRSRSRSTPTCARTRCSCSASSIATEKALFLRADQRLRHRPAHGAQHPLRHADGSELRRRARQPATSPAWSPFPASARRPPSAWWSSCRIACASWQRSARAADGGAVDRLDGEAVSALVNLGYRRTEAERAVRAACAAGARDLAERDPRRAAEAERMSDDDDTHDRLVDRRAGRRRRRPRHDAAPADARRVHRPGVGEGQPARRHRRRHAAAARASTTLLLYGPPGLGKTSLALRHRARDGRQHPLHRRPGDRAPGRPGGAAHQPRRRRRPVHRRDPPPQPRRRGDPLPGDGGLPDRRDHRAGPVGALDQARPEALHADRRDDARRAADLAAARPLRRQLPPRLLHARRARRRSCAARRASSTCRSSDAGASEIARRARGTPRIANRLLRRVRDFAQVRADGVITADVADQRAAAARGRRARLRQDGPRHPARHHRQVRRRPGRRRDARRRDRRGARHDRGRLRAVPHPGGLPQPHAQGPRRHAARLRPLRPRRARPPRRRASCSSRWATSAGC